MKQRVTLQNLSELTASQKQRLNEIWMPAKYDAAVAYVCRDVTSDQLEEIEFVIGRVDIFNNTRLLLHDIRALCEEDNCSDDPEDQQDMEFNSTGDMETFEDGTESEEGFADDYGEILPVSYLKGDCLPLLTVGQMIELLEKLNFGKHDFYINVCTFEIGCELGKSGMDWKSDEDYKPAELCDVLWESLKAAL